MFNASEVRALAADLSEAPFKMQVAGSQALAKAAHDIEASAKINAPVDTGNLRNSISADINGMSAEIGPTADYGIYLEYGTSKMAPQPFLGPAFDEVEPGFVRAIEELGGNIL